MPNQEKVEKVARLKERIEGSTALLLADYRGLTTADVTDLRRSLDETATRFAIVKNTLMQLAAEEAGLGNVSDLMQGPTAVGFVGGDAVAAAKRLLEAAKRYPALELKGAWVEGRLLSASEAQTLATLDSREAMLSKVAGLAKSEMSRAAALFQTLQSRFVGVLEAYRETLPGEAVEEAPAEAPPEAPPEPTPETTADVSGDAPEASADSPTDAAADAAPEVSEAPTPDAATEPTPEAATDVAAPEPPDPSGGEAPSASNEEAPAVPDGEE